MNSTILAILLKGTEIFTEERRRHFSKEMFELKTNLDSELSKVFPDYNGARVALAKKELNNFTEAYAKEFSSGITELLAKVAGND